MQDVKSIRQLLLVLAAVSIHWYSDPSRDRGGKDRFAMTVPSSCFASVDLDRRCAGLKARAGGPASRRCFSAAIIIIKRQIDERAE